MERIVGAGGDALARLGFVLFVTFRPTLNLVRSQPVGHFRGQFIGQDTDPMLPFETALRRHRLDLFLVYQRQPRLILPCALCF
jgi:hypothetical protein